MARRAPIVLFVCGDVMTGRGIDQILPHPSPPRIHESYVRDAREYVAIAERLNGPVPRAVEPPYVWGDSLTELARVGPDARIVNLETSVTSCDEHWPGKGIHYRMHPANASCLTAAGLDVCVLANNHVLDYGRGGLAETLETLNAAGIRVAGAGRDLDEAWQPAIVDRAGGGRVVVFSAGVETSGIPREWAAGTGRSGVNLLPDLSDRTAEAVLSRVHDARRDGDVVVFSVHWGGNWGYEVPAGHVRFAHRLLDDRVDLVHGHSSHHFQPLEVYRDKLVLYGCGDFVTDYEGIEGYEEYRSDLALMYFPVIDSGTGRLVRLTIVPLRVCRMRLEPVAVEDAEWVRARLTAICGQDGMELELTAEGHLLGTPAEPN